MLQACHLEKFVRQAVVALGALRKSIWAAQKPAMAKAQHNTPAAQRYSFAIQQYSKAIKNMRMALMRPNCDLRSILIGCLLAFCFEAFQGSQDLAVSHAQSGYQLIQDRLLDRSELSSPEPEAIDDAIMRAFVRLDLQIMTVNDTRLIDAHQLGTTIGTTKIDQFPEAFSRVQEAYTYWELVMTRSHHFIRFAVALVKSESGESDESISSIETDADRGLDSAVPTYFPRSKVPMQVRIGHLTYAAEIMRWRSAFKSFYSAAERQKHPGLEVLLVHAKGTYMIVKSTAQELDSLYDYLPDCQEVVSLANSFLSSIQKCSETADGVISIDIGIIPALYVVIKMCPDQDIRWEAVRILRSLERREGVWNSLEIADIGSRIISEQKHA